MTFKKLGKQERDWGGAKYLKNIRFIVLNFSSFECLAFSNIETWHDKFYSRLSQDRDDILSIFILWCCVLLTDV